MERGLVAEVGELLEVHQAEGDPVRTRRRPSRQRLQLSVEGVGDRKAA